MFDRTPDATLVADLVRAQQQPEVRDPDAAAVELIEQLIGWQRLAAWVESQRLDTMRRFAAARTAADESLTCAPDALPSEQAALARLQASLAEQAGRFAAQEIALALNISPTSAAKQLTLAHDLHEVHPALGEALELGQVSGFVAHMVAQATRRLPEQARQALDEAVTTEAVELPAGQAIEAARTRALTLDEHAETRAASARDERRVFFKPLEDDMAMLGAVLPAADALCAFEQIERDARAAKADGAPDPLDHLRCESFVRRLVDTESAGDAATAGPRVSVQVVMSLSSLLGLDSEPAWLNGYGVITRSTVQQLVAAGDVTLSRLFCDPLTGAVVASDPTRYTPSDGLRHAIVCRDRCCRMPVCAARVRHLDHIRARVDGGLTDPHNLQGLSELCHLTKHHPGWRVHGDGRGTVFWQTPTGHTYGSSPPPAVAYGTGPPPAPDDDLTIPAWLSHEQRVRRVLAA